MAIFIASQVCATTFILVSISFFFYFRKCYMLNTRLLAARTPSFVGVFFELQCSSTDDKLRYRY